MLRYSVRALALVAAGVIALTVPAANRGDEKPIAISAVALTKDLGAEQKYKGKELLIDGKVKDATPALKQLLIQGDGDRHVGCFVKQEFVQALGKLKKGDKVKVRGKFAEVIGNGIPKIVDGALVK